MASGPGSRVHVAALWLIEVRLGEAPGERCIFRLAVAAILFVGCEK